MKILTFDLSLSSTGVAFPDMTTRALRPPKKLDGAHRLCWLRDGAREMIAGVRPNVIIVEGYSYGSANQAHQVGEWGGVFRLMCWEMDLPTVVVPPHNLKKWITGHGLADKKKVYLPTLKQRAGRQFETDDEAEAFALSDMGYAYIGRPGMVIPHEHRDAWAKIEWTPAMIQAHIEAGL